MALKKPKLADTATTKSKASANAPVLDLDWMRSQAAQVVSLLKVIGNPDRLLLLWVVYKKLYYLSPPRLHSV